MGLVVIKIINNAVKIGYSGKKLGNVNERFGPGAEVNFAKFTAKFPGKTIYDMPAVGKDNIVDVDNLSPQQLWEIPADGLVTRKSSALLVLKAADCIPLVFYVPGEKILALAHAGTSGAALHLPEKMLKELGRQPAEVQVYVGPHVSQKSYRFPDKDLSDKELDKSWDNYFTQETDGLHIDLLGYVIDELKNCGVRPENIEVSEVDTAADENYYSHRRHKITGEPTGRNCFGACLL
jgi:copper oxidase (laccase) domain-containing protein